jgi:hypothetical protein
MIMSIEHNHQITVEAYHLHHSQRKIPKELQEKALDMLNYF